MSRRTILIAGALVVAAVGWYLFRPERLWIDSTVDEDFPTLAARQTGDAASPAVLAAGRFHGVAHEGTGRAAVFQLPDGQRILRFTEFAVSNGPDVQVYMVAAADANDDETVERAGFVSLGPIKGNQGDQNYTLPAGLDLSKYRAVTIWCRRFGVNFATAPLAS